MDAYVDGCHGHLDIIDRTSDQDIQEIVLDDEPHAS